MPEILEQPISATVAPPDVSGPDTSIDDRMERYESNNADRFDGPKPVKEKAKPAPASEPAKPAAVKPAEPAATAPEKPADAPAKAEAKTDAQPAPDAAKPKPKPWEMYHGEKKARETVEKERDAYKAEIEALRKQQPQFDPQEHPEFKKISTRAKELEEHIKFVDYTKSTEFQEKFQQPYVGAWSDAVARVKQFQIPNADGTSRAITESEFSSLVADPDDNAVADKLAEWFGTNAIKADRVMAMRDKVREAGLAMERAKQDYRTKGEEREKMTVLERQRAEKADQAKSIERAEKFHAMAESALKDERLAPYFKAPEDDPKAKELFTKGMKEADIAFGLGEDTNDDEETSIGRHASIRNKAGSWPMLKYLYDKSKGEIAELKKQLEQYEKSEPSGGSPAGSGGSTPESDDVESRLMKWQDR